MEKVVLVNKNDEVLGEMEKQKAHELGVLHRAISIFIFNSKGEMLLQQRSEEKYHSPLLWTNACCSHPRLNETYLDAANRRLFEELGFTTELKPIFNFIYKADVGNQLIEHELDYVFKGIYDFEIPFNNLEVQQVKWISVKDLVCCIHENPEEFTAWFKIILNEYFIHFR
jgi:isopentenyl-diphosphate delta-isomerase